MTQYDDRVQYQRDLIAAEKWAETPKYIHIHSLDSITMTLDHKILKKVL